ncbi:MAG: hypothetical protein J5699_03040 [Bacteroidales bacterium]|nr:hypothetical protein [Bacteroidales bacterium]
MKKFIKLILALAVIVLAVRWCSSSFGGISIPGFGNDGSEDTGGGWFGQKEKTSEKGSDGDVTYDPDIRELEKQLGIGTDKGSSTTVNTPSSSTTASSPLSFKGIPISGSLSSFGSQLVKAGFRSAGNGTYTGDFAGYRGCTVTPSGNPVQDVRVDFPVISDWDALEKAYDSLQASLTQKYGIEPVTSTSNNLAIYNLPNGTITLDADVKDRSSWHVILTYTNDLLTATPATTGNNPHDDL